jgi:hypothetical protein
MMHMLTRDGLCCRPGELVSEDDACQGVVAARPAGKLPGSCILDVPPKAFPYLLQCCSVFGGILTLHPECCNCR